MSVFLQSYTRVNRVFPSNTVDIPPPFLVLSSENTGFGASLLIDTTVNFIERGIKVGDTLMVINGPAVDYAIVTGVNINSLNLSANILSTTGNDYSIYQGKNPGCYLYIGTGGAATVLDVITLGGDTVSFTGLPTGTFLPVQVTRVLTTSTVSNILALW